MRKLTSLLAGFAALFLVSAATAQRSDTDDMRVTANVQTFCQIGCVDTLNFGTYSRDRKTGESEINVTCVAADEKAKLALGDGMYLQGIESTQVRRMKRDSGEDRYLAYVLKVDDVDGPCWGGMNVCASPHEEDVTQDSTQQTFEVYGEIPGGQPLFSGSYSDNIIVTVTF